MKPSHLSKALEVCITAKQPVCIWGPPGIGKSNVVHQLAEHLSLEMKDIRAVLLDPVDLRGLPTVNGDGRAKWAIPDFLPRDGEGILFLDELNRAPTLVQNACFQLVLDRKLGEYELPDGWSVIAACNPTGAGTSKMSDALVNRFVHLDAETDLNDWCNWAVTSNIEPVVIAFLRFRNELLHKHDAQAKAYPTPRSWEFVSRITATHPGNGIEHELFKGAVGEGAATEYSAFLRLFRELPNIDQILMDPKKALVPDGASTLYAISSALARRTSETNIARVIQYLDRLPQEYAVMAIKDATARDKSLCNLPEFTKWVLKHQEAFA